jgi:isopenicillin N synthase-like dioxygenase
MLQIWTNDTIKSTYHRVVSPPDAPTTDDGNYAARYSIAVSLLLPLATYEAKMKQYFAHPDHQKELSVIDTCWDENRPQKYQPMKPGDWMVKRLAATY